MLGSATKSFSDIVMNGKMIENAIRNEKIEARESNKRSASRRKENEVNNVKAYNKSVTVSQPRKVVCTVNVVQEDKNQRKAVLRSPVHIDFDVIQGVVSEVVQCTRITGHSIENCMALKKVVERLISMGVVKFDDSPNTENLLPNHADKGVNMISEKRGKEVKNDIAEVKTPLKWVWREMAKRGLVISGSEERYETKSYCEFHREVGHEIQECEGFKALVQSMMDNKEMRFYEGVGDKINICASELAMNTKETSHHVVIISCPRSNESRVQMTPKIIIQKPSKFPFKDNKMAELSREENWKKEQKKGKAVEVEPLVNEPVKEEELRKQLARISILALLLSSEAHRNALLKVLNKTYVADDISVNKLDRLANNINTDNFIFFSDDEIPSGGRGSTKALHVTARYKGYILLGILIDNRSALNVLPLSTFSRLPVDSSHMKASQSIVRAFDGTKKRVMGRIKVPLRIGPITYDVDFLVMDIKPSYNCLLGRPWIHSAGAVPSSLHQKVKIVSEGRVITINAEEDIIAIVTGDAPYVEIDDEEVECSFRSLEFVNAMFIAEGSRVPVLKISRIMEMGLQLMIRRGASPGRGLGKSEDIGEMLKDVHINAVESSEKRALLEICPYEPGSELNNWTAEEIPIVFRAYSESSDINDMSDAVSNTELLFEQDMCLEGSHDFKNDEDCVISPDLSRMVEQENEQILPYRESLEIVSLDEGKEVKIGTEITTKTRQDLIELLREFKDVFAWSYQDMPGLSTSIAVHRLPIKENCKPVQQKLKRMRPDVVLKIKEEVKRQFNAGFLQEIKYSDWVANIVPIPKKDGKKAIKGSAIADFLASRALEDYEPLNFDFPNENLMYVASTEENPQRDNE
ncbi:uncharacterized protein LOC105762890 [Gossypium raimondii]|uniref:uncharacterized protein LOC105762890 n=1 Tax=Gossypium raimondii TaxID=29730 RepID=UPI00227A2161|nr:uncharacterized protein LOC105762890 [Gossypium raimondii]